MKMVTFYFQTRTVAVELHLMFMNEVVTSFASSSDNVPIFHTNPCLGSILEGVYCLGFGVCLIFDANMKLYIFRVY